MNPILANLAASIQSQAAVFLPKAYMAGKLKAQKKYGVIVPWGDRDNANIAILLTRHADELSKSMVRAEEQINEGQSLPHTIQNFIGRLSSWSWALFPAMALGMASHIDTSRQQTPSTEVEEPNDIGIIWRTAGDGRVCKICDYLNGRWFDAKEAYDIASKVHPNCLLPDNEVVPFGLKAISRAVYNGLAYELTTAKGHRLTVTPNHMVLTPNGFLKAQSLRQGSDIINCLNPQGIASMVNPYDNEMPTRIEDIWNSLFLTNSVKCESVPTSPVDFHGDARFFNGDVDIIRADSFLGSVFNYPCVKHSNKSLFNIGLGGTSKFSRSGSEFVGFGAVGGMAFNSSSICGNCFTLGNCHPLHSDNISLSPCSDMASAFDNQSLNSLAIDMIGDRESQGRIPVVVSSDEPIRGGHSVGGLPLEFRDIVVSESLSDFPFFYTQLARQFLNRFPDLIADDQILEIRTFNYHGFVYDLQSSLSLYNCNGVIVKNCRCPQHFDIGTPDEATVGPVQGYKPGTAQDIYRDLNVSGIAQARINRTRRQNTPRGKV